MVNEFSLVAAVLTAFAAGLLSFLSPCVMPLMPAYLSVVSGLSIEELRARDTAQMAPRNHVMLGALGFVLGFSVVFIAGGATATVLGQFVQGFRLEIFGWTVTWTTIAGLVIILFGLHLMGLLRISWLYRERRLQVQGTGSVLRTALLGAAFAFGWTPCIGPVLAGILTLAAGQETVWRGVLLLSFYSLGLAVPFLLMALSLERFFGFFSQVRRHFYAIEVGSGALLVVVGVFVMTNYLTAFNRYFAFLTDLVLWLEKSLL